MDRLLQGLILMAVFAVPAVAQDAVTLQQSAGRATVTRGDLVLLFDPSGHGFVTTARHRDRVVGSASESSGLFASLLVGGDDMLRCNPFAAGKSPPG